MDDRCEQLIEIAGGIRWLRAKLRNREFEFRRVLAGEPAAQTSGLSPRVRISGEVECDSLEDANDLVCLFRTLDAQAELVAPSKGSRKNG